MNNFRLLVAVPMFISAIASTTLRAAPVVFDDGNTHTIDYTITNAVAVTSNATVNVNTGADISGSAGIYAAALYGDYSSTVNINDGVIQGTTRLEGAANIHGGSINDLQLYGSSPGPSSITGGTIDSAYIVGDTGISGGNIDTLFSESGAQLDISGGTFGSVSTISGLYDITGGVFSGGLSIDAYREDVAIGIRGGTFLSGFQYNVSAFSGAGPTDIDSFVFYGNLSLSTPALIAGGSFFNTYQATISGTLMDGSAISQSLICEDRIIDNDPCGGVAIISSVPLPPALWLFGSGLLGLTGISRRRQAASPAHT